MRRETLAVPDHSTLSRRLGQLSVSLPVVDKATARHVVVDSTGVKVYGEGELKEILDGIDGQIEHVSADGAYDHRHCSDEIAERQAKPVIPPRKDTVI